MDSVNIRNLLLVVPVGDGAQWPSSSAPVRQPVRVSISIPYNLRRAAHEDNIHYSVNYGSLSSAVIKSLDAHASHGFTTFEDLLDHIFATCFQAFDSVDQISIKLVKPRALPYADGVGISSTRRRDGTRTSSDTSSSNYHAT